MIKIAITGSRGFIGKHLVSYLKKATGKVQIIEIDLSLGYDILNNNQLKDIEQFDVLIHLAAKSFVPDSYHNPLLFYKTNVIGTLNALELCRKYNAKMIYTSSYVYGTPEYLPIDESHPVKAFNPYAQSKLIGEDLCRAYYRDFNISSIIFRPFNIYGKGQGDHFLIQSIINQAKSGIIRLKDSRPKRDFIYINDVVDAYIKAIGYSKEGVETFNLGSGISTSIKEVTEVVSNRYSGNLELKFSEERRKNEVLETCADISKAKKLLEWTPKVLFEEGITEILKNTL